jgi:ABC-type Fe3+/spermidine/putrescine transport system ATPase subunit
MSGLSVRGLTLALPRPHALARASDPVLRDVSFSAPAGAITALLGGPAAGKTVLLAGLAGLLKPVRGAVLVENKDVTALSGRRRRIRMLPPGSVLAEDRVVRAALVRLAPRGTAAGVPVILEALGQQALDGRLVSGLTHGQGFAALAAARLVAAAGAEVMLFDEAGTGLEDTTLEAWLRWLRGRAQAGATILLATRNAALALGVDHLVLLHDGAAIQAGPPTQVYAAPRDAVAARLTGPANILSGIVRQKLPGGFVWAADGARFHQQAGQAPVLGGAVQLCLRPEALRPDVTGDTPGVMLNRLAGTILQAATPGFPWVVVQTGLGVVRAAAPAARLEAGQGIQLAWDARAASVILPIA